MFNLNVKAYWVWSSYQSHFFCEILFLLKSHVRKKCSLSERRSEHTDRNVELKPIVLFRTTHLEILSLHGVTENLCIMQSFKSFPVCCSDGILQLLINYSFFTRRFWRNLCEQHNVRNGRRANRTPTEYWQYGTLSHVSK